MSDRETFFPEDRPILVYEVRRPSSTNFRDPDGVPAEPSNAYARIFNGTSGEMVEVDGSDTIPIGPEGSLLYMSAMDEESDRGAYIYIKIPPEMSSVTGNYTIYITTEYEDGLRITHDQRVQISEFR